MTVYVDVSSAVHSKAGLGRYAQNLVRELRPLLGERLGLFQNSLGKRGPLSGCEGNVVAGTCLGYKPWRMAVWLAHALGCSMDRLLPGATLFHATEHLLPFLKQMPTVLTVHDLIFEHLPQYHKPLNYHYLRRTMPLYCRQATAIIAVSEATRADLLRLYDLPPAKVTVIPEAAAAHFQPPSSDAVQVVRAAYGLPLRYVLAVGTIEPRKNLRRLVQACHPLLRDDLIDAVVLVGGLGWMYQGFFEYLETLPWRERIVLPGYVADEDLPAVYGGALLMAQPSLYEGFGLPVLEAMACGSPVCASNASSLPEVGGDAAQYFDPRDMAGMTAVLAKVARDEDLRHLMRRRGLERATRFAWRRTAERTIALYEQVIARWGG